MPRMEFCFIPKLILFEQHPFGRIKVLNLFNPLCPICPFPLIYLTFPLFGVNNSLEASLGRMLDLRDLLVLSSCPCNLASHTHFFTSKFVLTISETLNRKSFLRFGIEVHSICSKLFCLECQNDGN